MRPNDLATKLVGKENRVTYGKQIRSRLREWYPRDDSLSNSSWSLTNEQVNAITAWHKSRQNGKPFSFADWKKAQRKRAAKPAAEKPSAPIEP